MKDQNKAERKTKYHAQKVILSKLLSDRTFGILRDITWSRTVEITANTVGELWDEYRQTGEVPTKETFAMRCGNNAIAMSAITILRDPFKRWKGDSNG